MLSKVTDSKSMTAFLEKFDSVKERYKTLNKSLADISKIKLDGKTMGINTLLDYLQNSSETSDETKQHIIDLRTELSKVGTSDEGIVKASELITQFTTEISNATEKEKELQKVNEQISGLRQRLSNDVSIADNGSNLGQGQTEAYRETVEKLNQTLTEYEEILIKSKVIGEQAWIDSGKSAEQYETEMKQMFKTLENGSLLQNQIGKNGAKSTAIESLSSPLTQNAEQTRDMIQQYVSGIEGANVATLKTVGNTNKWSVEVHNLGEQAKTLELSYNGVWTSTEKAIKANLNPLEKLNGLIKKSADYFASYFSGYMVAQQIISTIREAFSTVKDLDTAMVEVRKVSDETEASYANFSKTISQTAKEVAGTNKDLLTSSADWMRLGYSINDAAELAKDAQVFVNVGDGVDMQAATSDMITAMKAYNIEAKDAMSTIIDAYNIIGEQKLPNTQKCA